MAAGAAAVLVCLLVATTRAARRRGQTPLSTISVFCLAWGVSLALFAIPVVEFTQTRAVVWVAVYASLASFLGGAWLAARTSAHHEPPPEPQELVAKRVHIAWLATGVFGLLGFAAFLRATDATVGLDAALENPALARAAQKTTAFENAFGLGRWLSYFLGISLLLWSVALREGLFRGRYRLLTPLVVLVVAPYFFFGERLSLLTAITWIALFQLLWRPVPTSARVVSAGAVVLVAAAGFFYVVGAQKNATIDRHPEIREALTAEQFGGIALPYLYATANIPVFGQLSADPIAPRTYGQMAVLPVAKVVYRVVPGAGAPPDYGAFYAIPFTSYNSATWLGPFYRDFGFVGCVVLPAVLAFLATWAVIKATARRTIVMTWLAALALNLILFSPMKNQLPDGNTWMLILVAPVMGAFMQQRTSSEGSRVGRTLRAVTQVPRPRLVILILVIAAAAVVAAVALLEGSGGSPPASASDRLVTASNRIVRAYGDSALPDGTALASQLRVSDPDTEYEALATRTDAPTRPDVVGVFASRREFRVRTVSDGGRTLQIIGVDLGPRYRLVGPVELRRGGLVDNGGFEDGVNAGWDIAPSDGVRASETTRAHSGAYALQMRYQRSAQPTSSGVTQIVKRLPERAAGVRYTLRQMVWTENLSRQVVFGFQFLYDDGTSQYVGGSTRGTEPIDPEAPPSGIPAGSTRAWKSATASGVAAKQVSAIRVFAIDPGLAPLRGMVRADDVALGVRPGSGSE